MTDEVCSKSVTFDVERQLTDEITASPSSFFLQLLTTEQISAHDTLKVLRSVTTAERLGHILALACKEPAFIAIFAISLTLSIALIIGAIIVCIFRGSDRCCTKKYERFDSSKSNHFLLIATAGITLATFVLCTGAFIEQNKGLVEGLETVQREFHAAYRDMVRYATASLDDLQCIAHKTTHDIENIFEHMLEIIMAALDDFLAKEERKGVFNELLRSKIDFHHFENLENALTESIYNIHTITAQLRTKTLRKNFTNTKTVNKAINVLTTVASHRQMDASLMKSMPDWINKSLVGMKNHSESFNSAPTHAKLAKSLEEDIHRFNPTFYMITQPIRSTAGIIDRYRSEMDRWLPTMTPAKTYPVSSSLIESSEEVFCAIAAFLCFVCTVDAVILVFTVFQARRYDSQLPERRSFISHIFGNGLVLSGVLLAILTPFVVIYGNIALAGSLVLENGLCVGIQDGQLNLNLSMHIDGFPSQLSVMNTISQCQNRSSFVQVTHMSGIATLPEFVHPNLQHPSRLTTQSALGKLKKSIMSQIDGFDWIVRDVHGKLGDSRKSIDTQGQSIGRIYLQVYRNFLKHEKIEKDFQNLFNQQMELEKLFPKAQTAIFTMSATSRTMKSKLLSRIRQLEENIPQIPELAAKETLAALDQLYSSFSHRILHEVGRCGGLFEIYQQFRRLVCQLITAKMLGIWFSLSSILPVSGLMFFLGLKISRRLIRIELSEEPLKPQKIEPVTPTDLLMAYGTSLPSGGFPITFMPESSTQF